MILKLITHLNLYYFVSAIDRSNYGTHFVLGFTQQFASKQLYGFNEIGITAQCDSKITITSIMSKNLLRTMSLKAGKVFKFKVSPSFRMKGTGVEKKGIEIKSTADIAVIGINYVQYTSDAFLALPTAALGQTYVITSRINSGYARSQNVANFGVISQKDETKVTITARPRGFLTYRGRQYNSGQSFTVILNKLETFHLIQNTELSGTIITSSYPIAVLSGSPCEPTGKDGYCDHLVSFLLPVKEWGKEYTLVPTKSINRGDFYRVFASQKTSVKGKYGSKVLNRGEFLEIDLGYGEPSSFVSCSKPCQVVQYVKGYLKADPSSIILPSTEQFATSYKVVPMVKSHYTHYFTVTIEEKDKDALMVDEKSNIKFNWQKVKGTKYVWAVHQFVRSTDIESHNGVKFGVIIFAYGNPWQSYGYPAGFNFT